MKKFLTISELSNLLNLNNNKTKKPSNHILRYWEKEFKQIKPTIINNRRYYSTNQVNTVKLIKYLLKEKNMTIKGAKNVLKAKINSLDDYKSNSLKADYYKQSIKLKSKEILTKLRKLKKDGKKNSY
tara:strand:+ start:75 stop:455 length:381 start_codon:yes stop_codon:yes gene_type:complete